MLWKKQVLLLPITPTTPITPITLIISADMFLISHNPYYLGYKCTRIGGTGS